MQSSDKIIIKKNVFFSEYSFYQVEIYLRIVFFFFTLVAFIKVLVSENDFFFFFQLY